MRWCLASSWIFVCLSAGSPAFAQTPLPPGARTLINEDRFGRLIALCADTGAPETRKGAKTIRATAVWAGERSALRRLDAGAGACDPAWSPDGRRLAVTSAEGLWVHGAEGLEGTLRVESRPPPGDRAEITFRSFAQPRWSPDGLLLGLLVTNGSMSWVEVFEASTGRLFYTSPPGNDSFSWGGRGRVLKLGSVEIRLPMPR